MKSQLIATCSESPGRDHIAAIYFYHFNRLHPPTSSILPITAENLPHFLLPFPNQFLVLHHIQYWSLQPVQKLRLGTPNSLPFIFLNI